MRRRGYALVFVCTAVLSASGQVRFGAGVQGGTSISSFAKPASDYFSLGYGGGVHVNLDLTPAFGLRLRGDFPAFSSPKDKLKVYLSLQMRTGIRSIFP